MVHNYQPLAQRHFVPTNNNIKEATLSLLIITSRKPKKMELFKGDTKRGKHLLLHQKKYDTNFVKRLRNARKINVTFTDQQQQKTVQGKRLPALKSSFGNIMSLLTKLPENLSKSLIFKRIAAAQSVAFPFKDVRIPFRSCRLTPIASVAPTNTSFSLCLL